MAAAFEPVQFEHPANPATHTPPPSGRRGLDPIQEASVMAHIAAHARADGEEEGEMEIDHVRGRRGRAGGF